MNRRLGAYLWSAVTIAACYSSPALADLVASGLILNFQADNIDGLNNSTLTDGQDISTWVDVVVPGGNVNVNTATSAGATAFGATASQGMPNYIAGLAPAVRFTKVSANVGDALGFNGGIQIGTGSVDFTAFVVGDFTFTGISRIIQFGGKEPGVMDRRIIGLADNGYRFNGGFRTFNESLMKAPAGAHIATYSMDENDTIGEAAYRLDGVDGTQESVSTTSASTINLSNDGFMLGIGLDGGGANVDILDGNVHAILLYNRLLTSQEILDVESFLVAKFITIPEVGASALVGLAAAVSGLWRWNRSKKLVKQAQVA